MVNGIVNTKTTATGSYPVTGFLWWAMYDGQNLNEGLSTPSDNPYDGHCDVTGSTTDQWGYPCGGEAANYGDFLSAVKAANESAISSIATPEPSPTVPQSSPSPSPFPVKKLD
ncbi:MAG: hypothetical protein JO166_21750 [Deltaproteobacteria bacterium]|nr:hypothetical protein [Deltaproteobacteria bacterium]